MNTAISPGTWAKNDSIPGNKMVKELAKLLGQKESDVTTLVNRDILDQSPNRDQISSIYAMAMHRDNYARRSSPNNYVRATLKDPKKYPLTVQLDSLVTTA